MTPPSEPSPFLAWSAAPEFVLLLAAHTLADFVFQSRRMVENKGTSWRWFGLHITWVTATTALLLFPLGHERTWLAVLLVGGSHAVIDLVKTRVRPALPASQTLLVFVVDQTLHLASLIPALSLLMASPREPWFPFLDTHLAAITVVAWVLAAYAFIGNGGSAIVANILGRYCLTPTGDTEDAEHSKQMGHMIGVLERVTILTLVLLDQWGALGLILAAKSIARFKDLDRRAFGEYYLIGTLTSLLTAIATGMLVRAAL